jgi:hypothetical protein
LKAQCELGLVLPNFGSYTSKIQARELPKNTKKKIHWFFTMGKKLKALNINNIFWSNNLWVGHALYM